MTTAARLTGGSVAALCLALVAACAGNGDRNAVSSLAPTSLGADKKGGNGGGPPGSAETPMVTTVSDFGNVRSDGMGPYYDGVDGIHSGDIDGTKLIVNQTQSHDANADRRFWFDFNAPRPGSTALGTYLHGGTVFVFDDPYSPMDLAVGTTGYFVTRVNTYADFDGNLYAVHCRFGLEGAPLAPVTRISDTKWVLRPTGETGGHWCALNWRHPRKPDGTGPLVTEEYGQYWMDFEVTFEYDSGGQ